MGGLVLLVVVAVVLGGSIALLTSLGHGLRPVGRDEVETLAERADLDVTAGNIGLLVDAVARTRLWRTVGVLVALCAAFAAMVWGAILNQRLDIPLTTLLWGLVGYWAGCIIGELRTARANAADGPRSASLVRRGVHDYVGTWATSRPRLLAAIGGASALLAVLLGNRDVWLILSGAGAVVTAVVLAVVSRYVVERGRSGLEPDVAAADDAVRSRSLHAIAGATVGIGIWTASLAVAGLLLTFLARLGVTALETAAVGTVQSLAASGLLVLIVLCVIVPLVGFFHGRRLMREPFALARPSEVMP
jgi:hypothetical protein